MKEETEEETEEEKLKKFMDKHIYTGPVNFGTLEEQTIWREQFENIKRKRREKESKTRKYL